MKGFGITLEDIHNALMKNKLGRLRTWIDIYCIEERLDKRIKEDTISNIVEILDELYDVE